MHTPFPVEGVFREAALFRMPRADQAAIRNFGEILFNYGLEYPKDVVGRGSIRCMLSAVLSDIRCSLDDLQGVADSAADASLSPSERDLALVAAKHAEQLKVMVDSLEAGLGRD